jgi:Zn-dependent M28 family amino/carboxypeptidase
MVIQHAAKAKAFKHISERIEATLPTISETYLRHVIETIAIPRHYSAEKANNERIARWILQQFEALGYSVSFQGRFHNILALPPASLSSSSILVGAHYDSVPCSPGADDNGSGIAVLLACAKALAEQEFSPSVVFLACNREEDYLIGSQEFVAEYLQNLSTTITETHVMEMVGYCSHEEGSQHLPQGLPVQLPERGDFLGLVGNQRSANLVNSTLQAAKTYLHDFPVLGLSVYLGLEKYFPHLQRSDHAPFWHAKIPALMWTDTAEFRNTNYHTPFDTPDTLDYTFMKQVAQLLLSKILLHSSNGSTES